MKKILPIERHDIFVPRSAIGKTEERQKDGSILLTWIYPLEKDVEDFLEKCKIIAKTGFLKETVDNKKVIDITEYGWVEDTGWGKMYQVVYKTSNNKFNIIRAYKPFHMIEHFAETNEDSSISP